MVGAQMIVFFHVGPDITQAQMAVNSARAHGMECTVLTDADSPHVEGAWRKEIPREWEGIMHYRAHAYAAYNKPGIYLDTDMLIRRDLSPIMELDFDVALTKRSHKIITSNGVDVGKLMPYNGGFVAVQDPTFWPEVADRMDGYDPEHQKWYGDQMALVEAAKGRNIIELPTKLYNRIVKKVDLDVSAAWVLHFKRRGKEVMESYQ